VGPLAGEPASLWGSEPPSSGLAAVPRGHAQHSQSRSSGATRWRQGGHGCPPATEDQVGLLSLSRSLLCAGKFLGLGLGLGFRGSFLFFFSFSISFLDLDLGFESPNPKTVSFFLFWVLKFEIEKNSLFFSAFLDLGFWEIPTCALVPL